MGDKVAAGGHQGYAALGGLYTQARPMVPHLYGDLDHQTQQIPVRFCISFCELFNYTLAGLFLIIEEMNLCVYFFIQIYYIDIFFLYGNSQNLLLMQNL